MKVVGRGKILSGGGISVCPLAHASISRNLETIISYYVYSVFRIEDWSVSVEQFLECQLKPSEDPG